MALLELRQYKVREGKMSAWLELMEEEAIIRCLVPARLSPMQ